MSIETNIPIKPYSSKIILFNNNNALPTKYCYIAFYINLRQEITFIPEQMEQVLGDWNEGSCNVDVCAVGTMRP